MIAGAASSPGKVRWPRSEALNAARELCKLIGPFCERIVVAGSLRRMKSEVGDVEILYIPRYEVRSADLFSSAQFNLADEVIERLVSDGILAKRVSAAGRTSWGELNKLAVHSSGVPIDLFRTNETSWWNYLVCRTGPADSNTRIAAAAIRRGFRWHPYGSGFTRIRDGKEFPMTSEAAVFEFVGLRYTSPSERR